MSWYLRIKKEFTSDTANRGYQANILVNRDSLRCLLENYEMLDEAMRREKTYHGSQEHFESVIRSRFLESEKDGHSIFMDIASILTPLIEENNKRNRISNRYGFDR